MSEYGTKNLSWNESAVYAFGFHRLIGRAIGIWPLDCQDKGSKCRYLVVIIVQLTLSCNLINEFASGCVTVFNTVDFVGLLAGNCGCMLKTLVVRVHWKEMYSIVDSSINDWSNVRDDKSRKIMLGYAYMGRLLSIYPFYVGIGSIGPLILGAPPSIGRTTETSNFSVATLRNLPIGTGCSVIGIPLSLYLAFYLLELLQLLYLCNCEFGCDATFFGITMHLCGQLKLLKNDFAELGQRRRGETNVRDEVVASIKRHSHLLDLLDLVEDVYHVAMLGKLAGAGSYIALLGIQMLFALRDKDYLTVIYSPVVISIQLLQLFMYSFVGDYLSSHANDVQNSVYNCSWFNFSTSLKRDLTFVIMKSSRVFNLTAGNIFLINIESFTKIVKTIVSFFSVVKLTIVK